MDLTKEQRIVLNLIVYYRKLKQEDLIKKACRLLPNTKGDDVFIALERVYREGHVNRYGNSTKGFEWEAGHSLEYGSY